jgi:hypothetical protein
MLKTRLELHNEVYNSRLKREQKAKQRAGLIKRYIGTLQWTCRVLTQICTLCAGCAEALCVASCVIFGTICYPQRICSLLFYALRRHGLHC